MGPLSRRGLALLLGAALLAACSAPRPPVVEDVAETETPSPEGASGGSDEESLSPRQLTGVPGIDRGPELEVRILDARGSGRFGGEPLAAGQSAALSPGRWLLSDPGSEYEITVRSSVIPDGIVRLSGAAAFLVEAPEGLTVPRFRVFGGQVAFYLPHLPPGDLVVLTPAGALVTRGAVFSVVVSADFQVLVVCRQGEVALTGTQNASVVPGQVLVADRLGRGVTYRMTPNEALPFQERWLKVTAEEAGPVLRSLLPRRLAAWTQVNPDGDADTARFLALWFRAARSLGLPGLPPAEATSVPLQGTVRSNPWRPLPLAPGLLGETP